MGIISSLRVRAACLGVGMLLGSACMAEQAGDVVIGSHQMDALTVDAAAAERVAIHLPFHTLVYNGEPHKLVARGEDNLLEHVAMRETSPGKWLISAPMDMVFEQHADIDLEIPYLQMVEISVDADHVDFADNPTMWMGQR